MVQSLGLEEPVAESSSKLVCVCVCVFMAGCIICYMEKGILEYPRFHDVPRVHATLRIISTRFAAMLGRPRS